MHQASGETKPQAVERTLMNIRTLDVDAAKLEAAGVEVLFAPNEAELYPHVSQKTTKWSRHICKTNCAVRFAQVIFVVWRRWSANSLTL